MLKCVNFVNNLNKTNKTMIFINRLNDKITGSYDKKDFSIPYSEETFTKMKDLEETLEGATTREDYVAIIAEFEKLTVLKPFDWIVSKASNDLYISEKTGKMHLKSKGKITSIPMPDTLKDRIILSAEKGIDFTPLIKFWIRFLRNPVLRGYDAIHQEDFSYRVFSYIDMIYTDPKKVKELIEKEGLSYDKATELAGTYQVKVTKEGLLAGYKISEEIDWKFDTATGEKINRYTQVFNEDTGELEGDGRSDLTNEQRLFRPAVMKDGGDAFYCEGPNGSNKLGHIIKVGCTHRLEDWSQVNTNSNSVCVKGLHIGGIHYISGYGGIIHQVFVDPSHIGAVCDHETGAIRCIQYFVYDSFAGVNGSIYHSSTYAAKTDAQWETEKVEILKDYKELNEKAESEQDEINSI
jgi:hypothetical protein